MNIASVQWPILLMGIYFIVLGNFFIQIAFRHKRTGVAAVLERSPDNLPIWKVRILKGSKIARIWKGDLYTGIFFIVLGFFLSLLAILAG